MGPRRERVHLSYIPEWKGKIENWAKKFIGQNQWRCDCIHTADDLLQDAYLIFLKCYERYPRVVDPPHFMALFKKALWNKLNDHSRYSRRKRLVMDEITDYNYVANYHLNVDYNPGPILSQIADLPEEIRQALIVLQTHPELAQSPRKSVRKNLNANLWRILGLEQRVTAGGRIRHRLQIDFTGAFMELLA